MGLPVSHDVAPYRQEVRLTTHCVWTCSISQRRTVAVTSCEGNPGLGNVWCTPLLPQMQPATGTQSVWVCVWVCLYVCMYVCFLYLALKMQPLETDMHFLALLPPTYLTLHSRRRTSYWSTSNLGDEPICFHLRSPVKSCIWNHLFIETNNTLPADLQTLISTTVTCVPVLNTQFKS